MRQLIYTIFISNNHTSIHLWGKENMVKHQTSQNIMKMILDTKGIVENIVCDTVNKIELMGKPKF